MQLDDGIDQARDRFAVGDVDRPPLHVPLRRKLLQCRSRSAFTAARDHHPRALAREGARRREPDAAGAAGHQRDPVAHVRVGRRRSLRILPDRHPSLPCLTFTAGSLRNRSAAKSTKARTRAVARRPSRCTRWIGSGGLVLRQHDRSRRPQAPARSGRRARAHAAAGERGGDGDVGAVDDEPGRRAQLTTPPPANDHSGRASPRDVRDRLEPREVRRRLRRAVLLQIGRRRAHHPPHRADRTRVQRRIRQVRDAHRHVEALLHQVGDAVQRTARAP